MLVGDMRVSKADGSQATDLQRDALLAAGTDPEALYEDKASGKKEDRPELAACLKALRRGDTLARLEARPVGPGPAPRSSPARAPPSTPPPPSPSSSSGSSPPSPSSNAN